MSNHYNAGAELRSSVRAMADCVTTQINDDHALSGMNAELGRSFVALADIALGSGSEDNLVTFGAALRRWILANASEEEAFDWATQMPHPDIDAFEVACGALGKDPESKLLDT